MSGSQVFYMGENGEVILWDGTTQIDPAAYSVKMDDPPAEPTPGSIDFDIGYAAAIKDVLEHCLREGKQNLVQWLEQKLEQL